jgi:hypothetical protein
MRRALAGLGLAALAAATVFLGALLVAGRSSDRDPASPIPPDPVPPIQAQARLSPRSVHFGDTVTAWVDVTLDQSRADPDSVRIATDFAPWSPLGRPERTRSDGEGTTHLRTTWVLRCLASVCLPPQRPLPLPLDPATVTYDARGAHERQLRKQGENPAGRKLEAAWPQFITYTRLSQATQTPPAFGSGTSPFETPWRADFVSLPAVTYRVDPDQARIPLFAGAGIFALLGLGLAYLGWPRRRPRPVVVPEEPPAPVLTPLEQALELLENEVSIDGSADRRRALELVAAELAGRGNHDLALVARSLAWSQQTPLLERTSGVAEEARPALGLDAEQAEETDPQHEPKEESRA